VQKVTLSARAKLGVTAEKKKKKKTELEIALSIFFAQDPILAWLECRVFVEERLLCKLPNHQAPRFLFQALCRRSATVPVNSTEKLGKTYISFHFYISENSMKQRPLHSEVGCKSSLMLIVT